MIPPLSVDYLGYSLSTNTEINCYVLMHVSKRSAVAYFAHLILGKLCERGPLSFCILIEAILDGVNAIFGRGAPFKVVGAVVAFVAVYVVYLLSALRVIDKRLSNNSMHIGAKCLSAIVHMNGQVALRVLGKRTNTAGNSSASVPSVDDFRQRSNATNIRNFINTFKPLNRLPDFLHSSLHQREVITEGARQGGDESPFRPLKLAAQGTF